MVNIKKIAFERIITLLDNDLNELIYKKDRNKREINKLAEEQKIIKSEMRQIYDLKYMLTHTQNVGDKK